MVQTTTQSSQKFPDTLLNRIPTGVVGQYARGFPGLIRLVAVVLAGIVLIVKLLLDVLAHVSSQADAGLFIAVFGLLTITFVADGICAARVKGMAVHAVAAFVASACWAAYTVFLIVGL